MSSLTSSRFSLAARLPRPRMTRLAWLENGSVPSNLAIEIWEFYATDATDNDGPALELSDRSKKEPADPTEKVFANTDLAHLLMSKMKLSK